MTAVPVPEHEARDDGPDDRAGRQVLFVGLDG